MKPRVRLDHVINAVALAVLVLSGVWCVVVTDDTLAKAQFMQADELPLLESAFKTKWLHYKLLELATRSTESHDQFRSLYSSYAFDMDRELEWMMAQVDGMAGAPASWADLLQDVHDLNHMRLDDEHRAIDGSGCTQWADFDCSVRVPGVASNTDITVTVDDGQAACDALDAQSGRLCEWMPTRPDEVPEPQPPNLLNKCVCYACKGPLPDLQPGFSLPEEFDGSQRGTDGKEQCLTDPRFRDQCYWDGVNCVSRSSLPDPSVLNTTAYMERFDGMKASLETLQEEVWDDTTRMVDQLSSNNNTVSIVTAFMVIVFLFQTVCYTAWHYRPGQKWSMGMGFLSLIALYIGMAFAAFAVTLFTGEHLRSLLTTFAEQEMVMQKHAWDIIYYDAILTTSASRFVMTAHNSGWVDEEYTGVPDGVRVYDHWFINYIENVASLDDAIARAVEMSSSKREEDTFSAIDKVNKLLVDLEQIALCSCEPPDASALPANDTTVGKRSMYSPSYLEAKEIYNAQNKNFLQFQMQRLLVKIQEVETKARLMQGMVIVFLVFTPICLTELFRMLIARKDMKRRMYLEGQKRVQAVFANTVGLFAHPLLAIRGDRFVQLPGMVAHEDAQEQGLLSYFYSPGSCAGKFILFISHQWLSDRSPDPNKVQFQAIVGVVHHIAAVMKLQTSDIYVWLDYHSIPQLNSVSIGTGANAIMSLVNYTMHSSAMCIVAPTARHTSGQTCDFHTYMRRGWCRAEQAGYMLKNGTENLFISDERGMRMANEDNIAELYDAFFTMKGDFTCCKLKHPKDKPCDREGLVNPLIFLYRCVKEMAGQPDKDFIYKKVMDNRNVIFPPTYERSTDSGYERTLLFGDLLNHVDQLFVAGEAPQAPQSPTSKAPAVCEPCKAGAPAQSCAVGMPAREATDWSEIVRPEVLAKRV